MVGSHNRHHRVREANALKNFRAHHGMDLHLLELFRSQPSGLRNDVFRYGQLADIMQQRRGVERLEFGTFYAQFLGYLNGIDANPLQVIVSSLVFGFDGQGKGLNRSEDAGSTISSTCRFSSSNLPR